MMDQRTPEWFSARAGKVTASCIYKVMAKLKDGKPSADRTNYHAQLVAERLTGVTAESFSNAAMQWGTDTEPQARAMYSLEVEPVVEVGFIDHPYIAMAGASPDGLVGDKGLVEIKCPNTATHIATLTGAPIDRKYLLQMQWQMACTETEWCDFASFDPRLPIEMQLHVRRVDRDDALLAEIETEVAAFLAEVAATVEQLSSQYQKVAA
jgi:putative phage-type endonuclease